MSQKRLLRLLIAVTLSFVTGIVYATFNPVLPGSVLYLLVGIVGLAAAGYLIDSSFREQEQTRRVLLLVVLLAAAFLAGWGRYSYSLGIHRENHISDFTVEGWGRPARITGTVVDQPEVNRLEASVVVKPDRIWTNPEDETPIEVSGGKFMLQVSRDNKDLSLGYTQLSDNDIYGDRVEVTGTLSELMAQKNPGTFSYRRFLSRKGIYGAVWGPEELKRVEELPGNPVVAWALDLQTELLKVVKKTMPYPYSAFLGGSTLGLRGGLEFTETPFGAGERLVAKEFKAAGTFHVLAVSGLHVGVVAAALLAIFSGLRVPSEFFAPLILLALLIFTILTGARPATVRAAIMTGLIVVGMAYLKQDLKNSVLFGLTTAALLILLHRPRLIYEASFTLSFSAVFCLAVLTGPIESILEHIRDLTFVVFWIFVAITTTLWFTAWNWFFSPSVYLPYFLVWGALFYGTHRADQRTRVLRGFGFARIPTVITGFIAAQFAIQLGMMWPLSAYYFLKFPLAGGYVNLLAIPLVGVVVPLGLMAELVGLVPWLGEWLALILNAGNFLAVAGFMWVSHLAAEYLPYPAVRKFYLSHLAVLYGALSLLAWWQTYYNWTKRAWYWLTDNVFHGLVLRPQYVFAAVVGLGGILMVGLTLRDNPTRKSVRVTVLDVGYGSAMAVQTPGNNNILINGGRRVWDWHNRGLADRMDAGEMTVAPFFLNQRIKHLDLAVAQSSQPQYIGGFPYILKQFQIDRVVGPLVARELTPLSMNSYLSALDNDYYWNQRDAGWFRNDHYGGWKRFWNPIKDKDIPYERPTRGETLHRETIEFPEGSREVELSVLHPPERTDYDKYESNNRSLVLSLEVGEDFSVLFPGDLRRAGQRDLMDHYSAHELEHDVLVVPSSGTQESSVREAFVDVVNPDQLVFSTGYPDIKEPIARDLQNALSDNWEKARSMMGEDNVFRTDQDYAIIMESTGQDYSIDTFAERNRGQN